MSGRPPFVSGRVRGEDVHFVCATEEETTVTWGAFWSTESAPTGPCARCGKPLNEDPRKDAA